MPQSPTAAPGVAREAATRLRDALDAHLAAVEARGSEHDPAVQTAYKALRAAAAGYDEALYREHDEVTPFDLPEPTDDADDERPDPATVERLSLLARWDFTVEDADLLKSTAARAVGEEVPDVAVALAAIAVTAGHSRLGDPESAERVGLQAHGFTTWVAATDDADPGDDEDVEWMDDPFAVVEPHLVLCRLDSPVDDAPDEDESG